MYVCVCVLFLRGSPIDPAAGDVFAGLPLPSDHEFSYLMMLIVIMMVVQGRPCLSGADSCYERPIRVRFASVLSLGGCPICTFRSSGPIRALLLPRRSAPSLHLPIYFSLPCAVLLFLLLFFYLLFFSRVYGRKGACREASLRLSWIPSTTWTRTPVRRCWRTSSWWGGRLTWMASETGWRRTLRYGRSHPLCVCVCLLPVDSCIAGPAAPLLRRDVVADRCRVEEDPKVQTESSLFLFFCLLLLLRRGIVADRCWCRVHRRLSFLFAA